jgi:hypothetical protein
MLRPRYLVKNCQPFRPRFNLIVDKISRINISHHISTDNGKERKKKIGINAKRKKDSQRE